MDFKPQEIQESKYIKKMFEFSGKEAFVKHAFLYCAEKRIRKPYLMSNENKVKISELLKYFTGNECSLDLSKGIFIYGNFGVGKTTILESIKECLFIVSDMGWDGKKINPNSFMSASIEIIIEHFKKEKNLVKYGFDEVKRNLCIHEFLKVMSEKIYGTDVNSIIESLIMIRYELYQIGYLTHATSNVNPFEIEMPEIVRDRMVEMFNFIEINGTSLRK